MKLDKRNKLLIGGFIFMLFISYQFAISKTLFYYRDYNSIKERIGKEAVTPNTVNLLKQKEKHLDTILVQYSISPTASFQNDFLENLSRYCSAYGLRITDFKEPHTAMVNQFQTSSYQFTLGGSFNGSLSVINKIENSPSLGIVRHLAFVKSRDYKTNTDNLSVTVILQKNTAVQ